MVEYIDREAAIKAIEFSKGVGCSSRCTQGIKYIPAADVVEVVRCKDCKYWAYEKDLDTSVCVTHSISGWRRIMPETAYCSMGVRKEVQG